MSLKKCFEITFTVIFLSMIMIACSSESTAPGDDKAVSGSILLTGQNDHSGTTVMIFQPVTLDTVLTNLNQRYPNQGFPLSQRSEFQWWDHSPVKQTTTAADGSWQIEGLLLDTYHVVVSASGYGWRIKHNASGDTHDFDLSEAISFNTTYTAPQTISSGSYVEVSGSAVFSNSAALTIEAGVIVEFLTNARLEVNSTINVNGSAGNEVFFVSREAGNNTTLILDQANNSNINYATFLNLEDGLLITSCNTVTVSNSRVKNGIEGINLFNSQAIEISNCVVSNQTDGIITHSSGQNRFLRNFLVNVNGNGLGSLNEDGSLVQNNIFKNCAGYGLNLNFGGSPSSLFGSHHYDIINNDFIGNASHIRIGRQGLCLAHGNNLLGNPDFNVWTSDISVFDSLDFTGNYWGTSDIVEIMNKIYDRTDTPGVDRPEIDFANYTNAYINW